MSHGCFRISLKMKGGDVFGKRKSSNLTFQKGEIRWALIIILCANFGVYRELIYNLFEFIFSHKYF